MAWVEGGMAPDKIVATKFRNDSAFAEVESQRPLCVYPKQARYLGRGGIKDASNWECVEPETDRVEGGGSFDIFAKLTDTSGLWRRESIIVAVLGGVAFLWFTRR